MRKKLIIWFLVISPFLLKGQDLTPFVSEGAWGFKDTLGNTIIEPQYQHAKEFHEDYAVIAQQGTLGIIDKYNNQVILPQYDYLRYIGKEKFIFGYRAKYFGEFNLGIINSKNVVIIPAEYYNITLKNEHFVVTKQSYEITNNDGQYDTRKTINKYGIIDSLGHLTIDTLYSRPKFLSNKYLALKKDLNGNYALFNDKFLQLTEFKYKVIGEFNDGLSKVRHQDYFGYLNEKGEEEIKCKYELNYIFIDSLAIVRNNGKAGIINRNEDLIIGFKFQALGIPYKNQLIAYDSINYGIISMKGDTLLPFLYKKRISEFKGLTGFQKLDKWQIWDYENKILLPEKYDELILLEEDESNVLGFGRIKNKKHSKSMAFVRNNEQWGVVNEIGEILIPIEFKKSDLYKKLKSL